MGLIKKQMYLLFLYLSNANVYLNIALDNERTEQGTDLTLRLQHINMPAIFF